MLNSPRNTRIPDITPCHPDIQQGNSLPPKATHQRPVSTPWPETQAAIETDLRTVKETESFETNNHSCLIDPSDRMFHDQHTIQQQSTRAAGSRQSAEPAIGSGNPAGRRIARG